MNLDDLKKTEIFEGKTLDQVLKLIFEHSLEERQRALDTFDDFYTSLNSADEWFMFGEKGASYLKIANDATETLNKMLSSLTKLKELGAEGEESESTKEDILDILDKRGIGPKRFFGINEEEEKDEENGDNKEP